MMLKARLSEDWTRVLCGDRFRKHELGERVCESVWIDEDDHHYRSPYYMVALPPAWHLRDGKWRMTQRAKERVSQERRPTYHRGAAGPNLAGKKMTGQLCPLDGRMGGEALVICPICRKDNVLSVEALHLVDWEDRGDSRIVTEPPLTKNQCKAPRLTGIKRGARIDKIE